MAAILKKEILAEMAEEVTGRCMFNAEECDDKQGHNNLTLDRSCQRDVSRFGRRYSSQERGLTLQEPMKEVRSSLASLHRYHAGETMVFARGGPSD